MRQYKISGKTIVIPRTSAANPILKEKLAEMGATVREVYVYDSTLPSDIGLKGKFFEDLKSGRVNAVVFGSGLCAKNLFEMLKDLVEPKKLAELLNSKSTVVAIGPVTEAALVQLGVESKVTPCNHTFEDALTALAQYWQTP
jgi:uroporphyrinogen-III synthase